MQDDEQTVQSEAGARRLSRVGAALASPLGIALVFPGIVLATGVFLVTSAQQALEGSNLELVREQLRAQGKLAAAQVEATLAQADPMLEELASQMRDVDADAPMQPSASVLRNLLCSHAGVAYVSVSFTDGTFRGAYLDVDHSVRFQESRVLANGTTRVRRFDYDGLEALRPIDDSTSAYDPRGREFFKATVQARGPIWTRPYTFFASPHTGITRTAPLFREGDRLHAVLTVDFDVAELSRVLETSPLPGSQTLLFTSEGILLGFPNAAERLGALPTRGERPLSFRDLGDADLEAFFASVHGASADAQLRRIAAPSGELLVVESQVGADPALDWRVAYLVPEAAVLGIMRSYWWESSTIAGIAAALAALLSLVCARFVFRVRLEARAARSDAELARSEARAAVKQAKELGSYRLVECLGKGGMGEVWLAELRLLARAAAIKMIRADSGVDGHEARERFRR